MPGIIDTNINQTDPLSSVAGYDAAKTNFDPATHTVAGQVKSIIDTESPLQKQAETRATQRMNQRGLVNTSINTGAGQAAVLDAALPIASQDANIYNKDEQFNVESENKALSQTSQAQSQGAIELGLANRRGELDQELQTLRGTQANTLSAQEAGQAQELETLRGANAENLLNIEANYKNLIQANSSAGQFFSQTSSSISQILEEPNITIADKNTLVQKQIQLLQNGMAVIGGISNLDLNGLLNYEPVTDAA